MSKHHTDSIAFERQIVQQLYDFTDNNGAVLRRRFGNRVTGPQGLKGNDGMAMPPLHRVYVSVAVFACLASLFSAVGTVHARNFFHLSAAMYDAWAAWSETASSYRFGEARAPCSATAPPAEGGPRRERGEAISHAAWRLIRHRFAQSPGAASTLRDADTLMAALGFETGTGAALGPAAALGACIGRFYIARGLEDGSNEVDDYTSIAYAPANDALEPSKPGNPALADPDRWQPLDLELFVGQSGFLEDDIPEFVTPEWGLVAPFALTGSPIPAELGGPLRAPQPEDYTHKLLPPRTTRCCSQTRSAGSSG